MQAGSAVSDRSDPRNQRGARGGTAMTAAFVEATLLARKAHRFVYL